MVAEFKTAGFVKGIQNKLPDEDIEQAAGSDALNWLSVDGKLELARGRRVVGEEGPVGGIFAEIWAPKVNGDQVHFVKRNTDIGYYDEDETFVPVITDLTAGSTYTFSVYSSLAGNFLFATGPDGLYKISLANPGSFKNMYSRGAVTGFNSPDSPNYLGYSIVQDRRMIMWNRFDDVQNKTALFLSKIDPQDGTNYSTVKSELLGTGNGSANTFTGNLAVPSSAGSLSFAFGLEVYSDTTSLSQTTITEFRDIGSGFMQILLSNTSGFAVGDYIHISDALGSPTPTNATTLAQRSDLQGMIFTVLSVTATEVVVEYSLTTNMTVASGTATRLRSTVVEDNNNGSWQGAATGSINYATGAVSVTLPYTPANGAPVYVYYLYENSNDDGLTDFSSDDLTDNTQGIAIQQEYAGEAIQNVLVFEGAFYSLKKTSVYELTPASDWSTFTNEVYRVNTGIPSLRAAVSTAQGIVYMDTGNPSRPILTILQRSTVGGNLTPVNMTPLFKWEDYEFDQCVIDTWGQYIVVSARNEDSETNDRLFLVNTTQEYSVDITYYGANTTAQKDGLLYLGSPTHDTVWEAFSGFDDLGMPLENYWEGKDESYGDDSLKKTRYLQFKGLIDAAQSYQIYAEYDNGGMELLGTILGSGDYVDTTNPVTIGSAMLGTNPLGGGYPTTVYPYLHQLKIRTPKFRVRKLHFVALGMGYVNIEWTKDFDILGFEQRLPGKYRVRNYVSLDGTTYNNPQPDA